jgi:transcriptional regulator with XRE-family HTH domain
VGTAVREPAPPLKTLRVAGGFTQRQLAEESGVSREQLSRLEGGLSKRPHRRTREALAAVLDVHPDRLFPKEKLMSEPNLR